MKSHAFGYVPGTDTRKTAVNRTWKVPALTHLLFLWRQQMEISEQIIKMCSWSDPGYKGNKPSDCTGHDLKGIQMRWLEKGE